ncbi:MAG TPA: O-acetylhomoserine aminocarboxypropyltransferase/cysteine synthase [Oscillospiraceae bacterium]|nr:O-acetylhomoserine aminocarboxypropyltransferase/cysteine synthase [Oscillospiraceae bacterium]
MGEEYRFDTLAVHAGNKPDKENHAVALPIYATTAYDLESAEYARRLFLLQEEGHIYSRLSNPTSDALERRVAAMEGGVGAMAVSSGHAAIFGSVLNLCSAGDELVSSSYIYGGAINMLGVTLKRLGITVRFVDPDDMDQWEAAVNEHTKAFFTEVIGNPNANVSDIERIAKIAHKYGIPLIADSTFTTPYLMKPFELGADLVIHSATKLLGGHGTAMAGLVVESGKFPYKDNPRFPLYNEPDISYHGVIFADMEKCFTNRFRCLVLRDTGCCISPFNSFLIEQGIETLSVRMERLCESTQKIAEYLAANPSVAFVNYPGLPESPYYELAKRIMPKGCGAVLTFGLKGGRENGAKFIDSIRLISHVANLGDVRTIATHPATTTHSQLSDEQLSACGIRPETVRISVGLEDVRDIIDDLDQAIQKAVK